MEYFLKTFQLRPLLILFLGILIGLTIHDYPINIIFFFPLVFGLSGNAKIWPAIGLAVGSSLAYSGLQPHIPNESTLVASVISRPKEAESRFNPDSRFQTCQMQSGKDHFQAIWLPATKLHYGDVVKLKNFKVIKPGLLSCRKIGNDILRPGNLFIQGSQNIQDRLSSFASQVLQPPEARIVEGFLLGNSDDFNLQNRQDVTADGLDFLLTLSGVHIFIYFFGIKSFFNLVLLPKWVKDGVLIGILILLGYIGCFSPAIVRATLMCGLALIAPLFRREYDSLSALALAGILVLLWRPFLVYSPSFQVSMLTVGIICVSLAPPGSEFGIDAIKRTLLSGLTAWLGSVPILAYWFGSFSMLGLLCATPVILLLLPLGGLFFLAFLIQTISLNFAQPIILSMSLLAKWIESWIAFCGNFSSASTMIVKPSAFFVVLLYLGMFILLIYPRRRKSLKNI